MKNTNVIQHIYLIKILLEKGANDAIYKKFAITESSFFPIFFINAGVDTIAEIKKLSVESSASLTQKMNKLEKIGFITRHINKKDKRKWTFKITKKGRTVLNTIITKKERVLNNLFKNFTKKERDALEKSLKKLQINLQDEFNAKLPCATCTK